MWNIKRITYPIASKDYDCDAWPWIDNSGYGKRDFTPEEWDVIQKARKENFKILKGTKYLCVRGKWDDEFLTYRARLDLNGICTTYDLFDYY